MFWLQRVRKVAWLLLGFVAVVAVADADVAVAGVADVADVAVAAAAVLMLLLSCSLTDTGHWHRDTEASLLFHLRSCNVVHIFRI